MARGINQVILMGRLTRDPETRTTPSGTTVVTFSLAVDRASKDDQADFFEITAWDKLGDLVSQYLSKGRQAIVQGRLRQESWDDKESGKKRSRVSIVATDVTFVGGRGEDSAPARSEGSSSKKSEDVIIEDIDDKPIDLSEIPF